MKRNALVATGFGAMIALGLVGYGCTSGDSVGGQGGSSGSVGGSSGSVGGSTGGGVGGSTGVGGATGGGVGGATGGGVGGSTGGGVGGATGGGIGGATGGGIGGATGGLALCAPAPDNGTACNSNPSCTKNCGVNASAISLPRAQKTCTCSGAAGIWSCPSTFGACAYPMGSDLSCFRLPTPLPACPADAAQPTGLLRTGATACTPATGGCGNVCGSATVASYQDSTTMKIGYCACVGTVWQCASVNEWPMVP